MDPAGETGAPLAVELCGKLADVAGAQVAIDLGREGCSAGDLITAVARAFPDLGPMLADGRVRACVNDIVVGPEARIVPGDRVALFPPVSGG